MPIQANPPFNINDYIQRAAERRAKDEDFVEYSQDEINQQANFIRYFHPVINSAAPLTPGNLLSADSWCEYLRNIKMTVGTVVGATNDLEKHIVQNSQSSFSLLDDLQREAMSLDAYVTEEEVKINGRYSQVHYNSWVRAKDSGLSSDDDRWIIDYKTKLPFQVDNIADIVPNTGLTLPVRQEVPIPIIGCTLVGEETDVGDTRNPIVSTNPINVVRSDKVFRYIIIRTDYDNTTRKYNYTPSYCTLLLEFANIQLLNMLELRPLGHSTVYIESLSYLNESGEEVELTEIELPSETMLSVLFEPIRTRYLKVKLKQYAPVTRMCHTSADLRIVELNKLLRGANFSTLFNEPVDEIQGRVYDFSIESINCYLRVYENLGVFRSQPIKVNNPIGCSYSEIVETIQVSNNRSYGIRSFLNEGEVLFEKYLGIKLDWKEGGNAITELVPIPDSKRVQREFLPISSGICLVKLFPDLFWNLDKLYTEDAIYDNGYVSVIVTNHGFDCPLNTVQTNRIVMYAGPEKHLFNFYSDEWYIIDENTIVMKPSNIDTVAAVEHLEGAKISPYIYIVANQEAPLSVYKEEKLLVLGQDYLLSFDRGSSWLSAWPYATSINNFNSKAQAGKFKIKILHPDSNKLYWCEYHVLRNQQLSRKHGVRLHKGYIMFDDEFRSTSGSISTVIVSRADSVNPYLTPVLLSYFLRIREHVD